MSHPNAASAGRPRLEFTALGTPAPQGSKTRTRFGMRDDNAERLKPWREAVKHAALDAIARAEDGAQYPWAPLTGPLAVTVTFYFRRPKGHYRAGRNAHQLRDLAPPFPASKPDIDKLQRSTFDACTDAGVWDGDERVVMVTALKAYADASHLPGATLHVEEL